MNKKIVLAVCAAAVFGACQPKAPEMQQNQQQQRREQPSDDQQDTSRCNKRGCCETEKAVPAQQAPAQAAQVVAPAPAQVAKPAPVEKVQPAQEAQTASGSVVTESDAK
ncbi:MAG: hypothetical protein COT85_07720 [Chlamydiae bacterium CG10_big_fil_rev_8_21_14_0_10_42_34]|nr:MAG: hypothetical protein COT85_07720 [Chlamydiae bacterium CG10_big_fil_rev_8_21_14_0_10_42_34]